MKLTTKEYQRQYRLKNKEKIAAYQKQYLLDNKEKFATYRAKNKDYYNAKSKEQRETNTLKLNVVYCIPNYDGAGGNYVGVTNNIYNRIANHKSLGKLNTENYIILDEIEDRSLAESIESQYHDKGYHGAINTEAGA